jgi:hypothetical protein
MTSVVNDSFKYHSMGSTVSRPPTRVSHFREEKSSIDPSTYLLGSSKRSFSPEQQSPSTEPLPFLPPSERLWKPRVTSPWPRTSSLLHRPTIFYNRPRSALKLQYLTYLTGMPADQKYKCDQCGMIFPSTEALFKHKTRFCIGVKDSGIGRKPVYSDDEDTPEPHRGRQQSPIATVRLSLDDGVHRCFPFEETRRSN